MSGSKHGANSIDIGGTSFLLTATSGGSSVHLARLANGTDSQRGAVHDFYFDEQDPHYASVRLNYDRKDLLDPRWDETTLCGRPWAVMVGGDGGPLDEFGYTAFAPTCKRCLSLMDKLFPPPQPDQRLALVVQIVTDLVVEHGYAEIQGVPGDQQDALRKQVRSLIRKRTGYGSQTLAHSSMIIFICEEIHALHAEEHERAAVEAIDRALSGEGAIQPVHPSWRIHWDTWGTSGS